MPNLDEKGPNGQGPKTGGQMGKCVNATPQNKPFDGRGSGMGNSCRRLNRSQRLNRRGRSNNN